MNSFCDIASTTRGLHYTHKEAGYVEIPFCRDPLAVIVNQESFLKNLTKDQLRSIFRGDITNWSQLSGPDRPIVLTVPGKDTGAYRNFHRQVMRMKDIQYDYTSYQSTQIIELVRRIPGSISFITRGAVFGLEDIQVIPIDGIPPTHRDYPLSQTFSFVTRGKPTGPAQAFVDFAFSDKGIAIIKKRGMVPIREYDPQGAE
jgi:phosphate transport system substrate-binding protein